MTVEFYVCPSCGYRRRIVRGRHNGKKLGHRKLLNCIFCGGKRQFIRIG